MPRSPDEFHDRSGGTLSSSSSPGEGPALMTALRASTPAPRPAVLCAWLLSQESARTADHSLRRRSRK
jgi:hypothetical protein